jgi:hypothetical protein
LRSPSQRNCWLAAEKRCPGGKVSSDSSLSAASASLQCAAQRALLSDGEFRAAKHDSLMGRPPARPPRRHSRPGCGIRPSQSLCRRMRRPFRKFP